MLRKNIEIINKLGMHARAAAKFVTLAQTFKSEIKVSRNNHEVNGKSIMGIMMLAAGKGTELEVCASGIDEDQAVTDLCSLINERFEEDQ